MPTTLPINVCVLPLHRRKLDLTSGVSLDLVLLLMWSLAMLSISLLAIRRGLPIEAFNAAFL